MNEAVDNKESLAQGVEAEKEQTLEDVQKETLATEFNLEPNKKPEGLDEEFWDEDESTIKQDELIKALSNEREKALGLRRKLSEKGAVKPPKAIDEYLVDESVDEIVPNDSDAMKILKETALESGLTKDQFKDFVEKLVPSLAEKGIIVKPEQELSDEEQAASFEDFKQKELTKLGKEGPAVLQKFVNWGDGLVNKGILSQDELPVFQQFAYDAPSLSILNKIMNAYTNESNIPTKTAVKDGLPSKSEIDSLIASDAYQKGDPKTHKIVTEYFQKVHG